VLAVSLPSRYLSGAANDANDVALWRALLGPAEAGLARLAALGVRAIEVSDVRGAADADTVAAAMRAIAAAGLRAHAHLWAPRGFDPNEPPAPLLRAAEGVGASDGVGGDGVAADAALAACAVHGHRRHHDGAFETTVAALVALEPWLHERGLRSALEVCRFKDDGPLGGTYAEVIALAEAAEAALGDELGLTWDLGHTTWNHQQGFDALWPPEAFVRRVAHVHIHDVADNGRTHAPLDIGRAPLAEFVARLRAHGYRGLWDLELYPERWSGDANERRSRLEASIARLSDAVTS